VEFAGAWFLDGGHVASFSTAEKMLPLSFAILLACLPAWPLDDGQAQPAPSELVRTVVKNEVKAANSDHSHWMYRQHHVDPTTDILEECVQSKDGDICRHLAENGHPLTGADEEREQKRVHNLISNPPQEQKVQKAKAHDGDEALRLLKMLPDAFHYTHDGRDGEYVRLKFEPNPDFDPPTREARVFHAMTGTLLVDPKADRMVELRGKLIKDVDFGWGLLGRLYQGGTFLVKRQDVGDGHWDTTLLDVDIHGKALFFHTINAQQREVTTDYRKVSSGLTLAQAASMLFSPDLQAKAAPGK
jgi:hypothetical protein